LDFGSLATSALEPQSLYHHYTTNEGIKAREIIALHDNGLYNRIREGSKQRLYNGVRI